jgi:CRISPR-associated protein Csd2
MQDPPSCTQGEMATQKLIVFNHDSELGNAPAHKLFDTVRVERKNKTEPARAFSDYNVIVDKNALPEGVKLMEIL